jgi:DNA-binding transcriptional ArsR family regulator
MRSTLDHLFGSRTRAKVLRLLLTNPEKSYFVREIGRKVHEHVNSVRRELLLLQSVDIVTAIGDGQKRYYRANTTHGIFPELKAVVFKGEVLEERALLAAIAETGKLHLLILTGFFVGQDNALTDILIVGKVNRPKIEKMMRTFQDHFDREIHYTVMTKQEFEYRHSLTDRFLYAILSGPMITVIDKRPAA